MEKDRHFVKAPMCSLRLKEKESEGECNGALLTVRLTGNSSVIHICASQLDDDLAFPQQDAVPAASGPPFLFTFMSKVICAQGVCWDVPSGSSGTAAPLGGRFHSNHRLFLQLHWDRFMPQLFIYEHQSTLRDPTRTV
ncbi:hypothetical protein INR49_013967 [Caranx melampygus]|nr:hypothetical protein INR49_013967 [Caranx melampygus]